MRPTVLTLLLCLHLTSCQSLGCPPAANQHESPAAVGAAKGYLDVVLDCAVDPSGSTDSTSSLQRCFNRAYQYGGPVSAPLWPIPVLFPLGVYVVSDTLNLTQRNRGPDDGINVCPTRFLSFAAFGSSAAPGVRPLLRLAASSPGFASSSYKAVVHIWQSQGGEGVDMNNVWKGIDVDLTLPGVPGAVAIQHAGAQGATVTDVTVRALPETFACFAGLNGAGGEHSNIECYEARYGIYADDSQPVPVLVGATLVNQSVSAIAYLSQESLSIVAVRIVMSATASGPAIHSYGGNRGMSIVDTAVECASTQQTAIVTPSSLYARDVFVARCGTAIQQTGIAPLPGLRPTEDGSMSESGRRELTLASTTSPTSSTITGSVWSTLRFALCPPPLSRLFRWTCSHVTCGTLHHKREWTRLV